MLDEALLLQAIKKLHDLENEEEKFEMLHAIDPFVQSNYLAARFKVDVGRDIEVADKRAIEDYVAAVYLVSHHNHGLSDIGEMERELTDPVMAFVRLASWAFLSAWSLNYGGLRGNLRVAGSPTLVDPRQ
ncbi:MAG TPA: hypothetical protein VKA35_03635 [Solirubrobacterales bacterium]|nr:hypothetical protein [Solirubrobacterales bacterium]